MSRPRSSSSARRHLFVFLALVCLAVLPPGLSNLLQPSAHAASAFTVNSTGDGADDNLSDGVCKTAANNCTLRAAIQQANAAADADSIDFNVTGTINLTSALPDIFTDLTITGPGSGQLTVRRDTGGEYRIFYVATGVTAALSGLTLTNGKTPDGAPGSPGGDGGGLFNSGTLTLNGINVTANRTGQGGAGAFNTGGNGGGIYNGGTLTMTNCIVSDNATGRGNDDENHAGNGGAGGGIYNGGSLTMTSCVVIGNVTGAPGHDYGVGGNGGGIYSKVGPLTLNGVAVKDNVSGDPASIPGVFGHGGSGGGIYLLDGTATLTACTLSGNHTGRGTGGASNGSGGGMWNGGDTSIVGSTISGNSGIHASGIVNQSKLTLTNCTLSNNVPLSDAGTAVSNSGSTSTLSLTNCTITGNLTGVMNFSSAPPTVANTIIAGNGGNGFNFDALGTFNSLGHNLVGSANGSANFQAAGDQTGTDAAPLNPRLGPLADNGGPTLTNALLDGSPALDAGDNALAKGANNLALTTDQRGTGFARLADAADADTTQTVDIGAYEAHPTVENIGDKLIPEDTQLSFAFSLGDAALGISSVTANSSNTSLLPNDAAHLSVSGSGSTRTLNLVPAADANTTTNGTSTITVTVTATDGRTASDTFGLTVSAVNDAPTGLALSNNTVADNSPAGTTVGIFSTTDNDAGDSFAYTLAAGAGDIDNVSFNISGNTLKTSNLFDFESKSTYALRVRTTDGGGATFDKQLFVSVSDGPDNPGAVSFLAGAYGLRETAGDVALTLMREGGTDNKIVAKVTVADVTTSPADYLLPGGALDTTFNPGAGANDGVLAATVQPDGKIIVGGDFGTFNGTARNRIARLNADGSLDTSFNPGTGADNRVQSAVLQPDGRIIIGGRFTNFNGTTRNNIARLNPNGSLDTSFNPGAGADDLVATTALQPDGKLLIGGAFTVYNGTARSGIARLNSDGSLDTSFNPGAGATGVGGDIFTTVLQPDGKLLIGGSFTHFNGTPRSNIARINSDGSLDATFNPGAGANDAVLAAALQSDGKLLIGGFLTSYNGTPRASIARLNTDGSLDTSFNPGAGANNSVWTTSLQPDGKLLIGGDFTAFNGTSRNRIARLNADGSLDTTFSPALGASSPVRTSVFQPDGNIIVGGLFTSYNGTPRASIARLKGDFFVTWAAGDNSPKTIIFTPVADSILEPNESLTLTVVPLSGGATTGTHPSATVTLIDTGTQVTSVSGSGTFGGTATLTATLVSGGGGLGGKTISFSLNGNAAGTATTNPNGVAILSGPSLSGINGGTYVNAVGAVFAGDTDWAASSGTGPLNVGKANQTITFGALSNRTFGDADFSVSATASSGLSVSFTTSGNCTVTGATVHLTGAGSCTINASQAGDTNYNAAAPVDRTFNIAKASQTISFDALPNRTFGEPDFQLSATASSGLTVSFAAAGNCTASGTTLHLNGAGTCTVTAAQAGGANYEAAANLSRSFLIAKAATSVALSSSFNPSAPGQPVTFMANVTSTTGAPTGSVQFKSDGTNLGAPVTLRVSGLASLMTSTLPAGTHAVTAEYGGDANFNASTGTLTGGQTVGGLFEFTQALFTTNERDGFVNVTVRRRGAVLQASAVEYATDDGSIPSVPVPCSFVTGLALERCDYTRTQGLLQFAPGETEKTFSVLVNGDSYLEGTETTHVRLSNPTAGTVLGDIPSAAIDIADDTQQATNPLAGSQFFVRQHYHDFLNREPDADGLNFWTGEIEGCGANAACREVKRINVSAAFFLSIEFQQTGYLVERMYKAAYGDAVGTSGLGGSHQLAVPAVRLSEFLPDTQRLGREVVVGQGNWEERLEANKRDFALEFVQRPRFASNFPSTMTAEEFVTRLDQNTGGVLTTADKAALVATLGATPGNAAKRAQVLRNAAENAALARAEFNRAFVLMQFFGYLRRDPNSAPDTDYTGYEFWLQKLDQFGGNYINAEMVKAFLDADEYKQRFGQ